MKQNYLFIVAIILLFTSCKGTSEEPQVEPTEEETVSQVQVLTAMQQYINAYSLFTTALTNTTGISNSALTPKTMMQMQASDSMPSITVVPLDETWPKDVTIDYGTSPVMGINNHTYQGIVRVHATNLYDVQGTVWTIQFENFYVDGYQLEGVQTLTNLGRDSANYLVFSIDVTSGVVTDTKQVKYYYQEQLNQTWIEGEDTYSDLIDDTYSIRGTQQGLSSDSVSYTITVEEPVEYNLSSKYPRSGKLLVQVDSFTDFYLKYVNATTVTVTIYGIDIPIPLN